MSTTLDVTPVSLLETVTGEIRSVNFFNGRLLAGEDLSTEQQAQHAERRLLGQALGDGVAFGLEVYEAAARSTHAQPVVTVEPGLAVSRDGQTLSLERRTAVALASVALTVVDAGGAAGVFSDCLTATPGTYTSGAGVYVLTIGPSAVTRGRAPVNGQSDAGAACAVDSSVEGVQFRLVGVPGMTAAELDPAFAPRLRNHVANLMLGTNDPLRQRFGIDPLGPRLTTYGRIDAMLETGLLTTGEVPLASLAWTESHGLQFVDLWSVRRRLTRRAETDRVPDGLAAQAAIARPQYTGDRARSEAEARALQFERHVEDLRGTTALETLVAASVFEHLPAAGLLPLAREGSRGVEPDRFFGAQGTHDGAAIDADLVAPLLREALAHEPIAIGGSELVQLYLLWESELAVQTGLSTQPVLVFAKRTIPYRGTRRYGYARFGAGRASRW